MCVCVCVCVYVIEGFFAFDMVLFRLIAFCLYYFLSLLFSLFYLSVSLESVRQVISILT